MVRATLCDADRRAHERSGGKPMPSQLLDYLAVVEQWCEELPGMCKRPSHVSTEHVSELLRRCTVRRALHRGTNPPMS